MKNIISFMLTLSMILFIGCSSSSPTTHSENKVAVDQEILSLYGTDKNKVFSEYGLSDDKKDETWSDYYVGHVSWCGEHLETKFLFSDDALVFVKAGKFIENDLNARSTVHQILELYKSQFGDAKELTAQIDWIPEPKQTVTSDTIESQLDSFFNAESGAMLCLTYESKTRSQNNQYIECILLRNEHTNPNKICLIYQIGNASFGFIDEYTKLDMFV